MSRNRNCSKFSQAINLLNTKSTKSRSWQCAKDRIGNWGWSACSRRGASGGKSLERLSLGILYHSMALQRPLRVNPIVIRDLRVNLIWQKRASGCIVLFPKEEKGRGTFRDTVGHGLIRTDDLTKGVCPELEVSFDFGREKSEIPNEKKL